MYLFQAHLITLAPASHYFQVNQVMSGLIVYLYQLEIFYLQMSDTHLKCFKHKGESIAI